MKIKVFFNNSCNICKTEIDHYKKHSDDNLEWVDITNNQEAINLTSKSSAELLRRLHVIDNGKVIDGAKAFVIIWSKICGRPGKLGEALVATTHIEREPMYENF